MDASVGVCGSSYRAGEGALQGVYDTLVHIGRSVGVILDLIGVESQLVRVQLLFLLGWVKFICEGY